jgi:hypothetical protein
MNLLQRSDDLVRRLCWPQRSFRRNKMNLGAAIQGGRNAAKGGSCSRVAEVPCA